MANVFRNTRFEPTMETRLLTVQQAARYLGISVSTLYGWVYQRKVAFVKVGRALRFDIGDLGAFIDGNRTEPKSAAEIRLGPLACYNTRAAGKG